ncbi:MAG: MFS transporter, partial [candidate division Zixibacteria bacterium]|nr:MFS transporter [candidate division Zixibacteria bacterium]
MTEEFIQTHRYKFLTIGAIGTFMGTLDGSILNVVLPTIAQDLGCGIDTVAWVVLAYSLTLVSLLMVLGAWTERKGYPFAYKFGYTLFFLGSLTCALSGTVEMLTFGRVVQATGAAVFQAVGIGMVTTVLPMREHSGNHT